MSANEDKRNNTSILRNCGCESHSALDTRCLGQGRVDGRHFFEKIRGLQVAADLNRDRRRRGWRLGRSSRRLIVHKGGRWRWWGWRSRGRSDDTSQKRRRKANEVIL